MRFCSVTLGCKVNQFETQAMTSILISRGHTPVQPGAGCDVCIINTCAVTAESARKSRQLVRRLRKTEPGALIAVCGCYSQLEPGAVEALGADLVGGSGLRRGFALEIEKLADTKDTGGRDTGGRDTGGRDTGGRFCCVEMKQRDDSSALYEPKEGETPEDDPQEDDPQEDDPQEDDPQEDDPQEDDPQEDDPKKGEPSPCSSFEELPPGGAAARTRALLKIQDGCDNFCAYCIVPHLRGRVRSLPVGRAVEQARVLEGQGFREIVITGIEIASYGKDLVGGKTWGGFLSQKDREVEPAPALSSQADEPSPAPAPPPGLPAVVKAVTAAAPRTRIRLGSLDPRIINGEFCHEMRAIPNLCNHFHLSLQSGCDATLRRMGRQYTGCEVLASIEMLRRDFPDCGITADLITGFPGETDDEFEQTLEFIMAAGFSAMHIFPYSPRPGTRAASMPGQVDKSVRIGRARRAAEAAAEMTRRFTLGQTGKTVEVLFERKRGGFWTGHSGNYLEVAVKSGGGKNQVFPVRIAGAEDGVVWGEAEKCIMHNA